MNSTKNWWQGDIDWSTPAGRLLDTFLASLPPNRPFHIVIYGSALLQLTVDHHLLSGDVDIFSENDDDLSGLIAAAKLDKAHGGGAEAQGHPTANEFQCETTRDSGIAATARAWGLTVVTRDTNHFPFVPTLNPFEAQLPPIGE